MNKKHPGVILCLLAWWGLAFSSSVVPGQKDKEEKPRPGGTLRIKPFTNVLNLTLDPAAKADIFLLEQLYDGLVRLDKDLNVAPALAEYWTISPDGQTYAFYLRRGVRFHSGRELTSADVKYSLERILDRGAASTYVQVFLNRVEGARDFWTGRASHVSGFRAVRDHLFEIHWTKPYVSGLYLLSMSYCKILPRDLVRDQGRDFFWRPVGTGPFRFAYWLRGTRLEIVGVRLERNPRYFSGRPHLEAIEYSPFYTLDHFKRGEIDIIPFFSESLAGSDCRIQEEGSLEAVHLGLSCHIPPFDDPAVRRAVSLAVDRGRIARAATTSESVPRLLHNFVPPRLPGFFPVAEDMEADVDAARLLLEKAGYPDSKPLPAMTLFVRDVRREAYVRLFRELQIQLKALGFRLSLRSYKRERDVLGSRRPYLVLIEQRMEFPDADSFLRTLFLSKSTQNLIGYANPLFDRLLEEADVERSWTKRLEMLRRAERLLAADMPALPLFTPSRRMAIQPRICGVDVPPLGFPYLNTGKIWIRKGG
ncbi:MAG: ABC transporter substrate-binding protein [Candidatus Aminicenantes bacterium]|nr:ABC transporter substrate-binding protein [Candidatus Aminicenantes bacterium]